MQLPLWMAIILFLAGCSGVLRAVPSVDAAPLATNDVFRLPQTPLAGRITLAWDDPDNASQAVGGYYLYYWQANWDAPKRVDVGEWTTYTLEDLEVGQLYTFAVTSHDGRGGKESVMSNKVHRRMHANGFTVEAPGVLANDHATHGDALTAKLFSGASNGKVDLRPDGGFTYTPHPVIRDTDSFTYRAVNGTLASNAATVTLSIAPTDGIPRANASLINETASSALPNKQR